MASMPALNQRIEIERVTGGILHCEMTTAQGLLNWSCNDAEGHFIGQIEVVAPGRLIVREGMGPRNIRLTLEDTKRIDLALPVTFHPKNYGIH